MIKRYEPGFLANGRGETEECMTCIPDGDYILYSDLPKIKADAIRKVVEATRESFIEDGAQWLCHADDLLEYADKLEDK